MGRGTWDVGRGTWDVGRGKQEVGSTWDVGRGKQEVGSRKLEWAAQVASQSPSTPKVHLLSLFTWAARTLTKHLRWERAALIPASMAVSLCNEYAMYAM